MLQDIGVAKEIRQTIAIASFVRNGLLSLLISGPPMVMAGIHTIPFGKDHLTGC